MSLTALAACGKIPAAVEVNLPEGTRRYEQHLHRDWSSVLTTADIVSVSHRIGRLRLDASGVRGEGGALAPVLVVGFSAEMEPRPEERQLALTGVGGELFLGGHGQAGYGSPS